MKSFDQQVIPPLLLFKPLSELNSLEDVGLPCTRGLCLPQFPRGDTAGPGTWEEWIPGRMHGVLPGTVRPGWENRIGRWPPASSVAPLNWELLLLCCMQGAPKPLPWHVWGCWCSLNSSTSATSEVHIAAAAPVFQLLLPQTKNSTHQKLGQVFTVEG